MKTIMSIILCTSILTMGFATEDKYLEVMRKNIESVYQASTLEDMQQAINGLERIAAAERTKWEPYYYASFGYIRMASLEKEAARKDALLDQAIVALNKAKEIFPNESEIIVLEGFALMIRVTVDPASRGPQYAGAAMQLFGKAAGMNPENPRAFALMAQVQYGTAQFFGSPTTEACATVNKALEKFATFKSDNPLAPVWGKSMTEELKNQCL